MDEIRYWVGLNMVLGVCETLFANLYRHFGSIRKVFQAISRELTNVDGVGEKTCADILDFDFERNLEHEFWLVKKLSLKIIMLNSPDYPALLKSVDCHQPSFPLH